MVNYMFQKKTNERIRFLLLVFILLFLIVLIKIIYIQTISYEKLEKMADDLWSRELPITAERGKILDRNGVVLADNITTTALMIVPNQIKDPVKVSQVLSEILNVSYDEMYNHITKNTSIERIHPEGRNLSSEVAEKINNYSFPGVYLVKESKRYYPYEDLLSHVIGFVGIDNQGLSGIELAYDSYLTGENGFIKYYSDGKGNKLELNDVYVPSEAGMDVMLTIDYNIQSSIERELNNIVSMFNPDSVLAIAMNPNTGEVLGMSSRPNFDSNNYKNYNMETLSRNLPIWSTYEPGSTFKNIDTISTLHIVYIK